VSSAKEAKSIFGQYGVDYERRVNFEELRKERMEKVQQEIKDADLGALILYDPISIRYATGAKFGGSGLIARKFLRFLLVPKEGDALLYEYPYAQPHTAKLLDNVQKATTWWYFYAGETAENTAKAWAKKVTGALKKMGLRKEMVGVDKLDVWGFKALQNEGIEFTDATGVMERARAIKTKDELELLKIAVAVGDVCIEELRRGLRPGIREIDLFSILSETNAKYGGENMELRLLASGTRTNPWFQEATDKIVRNGELVAFDTDMVGPMGYLADISRTYLCGDGKGNAEQKETYQVAYNYLQDLKKLIKPGVSFRDVALKAPQLPQKLMKKRYVAICHGVGLEDEWLTVMLEDVGRNYAGEFKENMVISIEAYAGAEDGNEGVKLEEEGIVTSYGYEIISTAPFEERLLQ